GKWNKNRACLMENVVAKMPALPPGRPQRRAFLPPNLPSSRPYFCSICRPGVLALDYRVLLRRKRVLARLLSPFPLRALAPWIFAPSPPKDSHHEEVLSH
ncbi:hypothetical protein, partial [Achromobacter dolens]|uniref:hypothetical protein n=1 Tax=Achromobacter dolens TaxID=1287738 RepID=UPI003B9C2E1B